MALGQAGGALAGGLLAGGAGTGKSPRVTAGPRLTALNGIASTEGAPVPRFGRARIGGQMIWATRFLEHVSYTYEPATGGKGGGATPQQPAKLEIVYSYTASFAIGLCEGPIAFVRRIWADGRISISRRSRSVSTPARKIRSRTRSSRRSKRRTPCRPTAASPMWCSRGCRSGRSATGFRN